MSFYMIAAMADWVIHTDLTPIADLLLISHEERKKDPRMAKLAEELRIRWSSGPKPHRLAVIGWQVYEAIDFLSQAIENVERLRAEYKIESQKTGAEPRLNQMGDDYAEVVKTVKEEQK